jgi:hypothetical protein
MDLGTVKVNADNCAYIAAIFLQRVYYNHVISWSVAVLFVSKCVIGWEYYC